MTNKQYEPEFVLPDNYSFRDATYKYHGKDEEYRTAIFPGRKVIDIAGQTWEYPSPEECERSEVGGVWYLGGMLLLCPRCGIDCT